MIMFMCLAQGGSSRQDGIGQYCSSQRGSFVWGVNQLRGSLAPEQGDAETKQTTKLKVVKVRDVDEK